jgi:DNA-binding MarR family transcriptional regulator
MASFDFPDSIDFWVAQVSRLHYTRVHALMEDLGLFPGQPPVLFRLWEKEGRSQTELADLLHIKPATMTKMINRMEKTGFIRRETDLKDQRVSLIFLTGAGLAVKNDVQHIFERLNRELVEGFTPEEQVLLKDFLVKLRDNLQQDNPIKDEEPEPAVQNNPG